MTRRLIAFILAVSGVSAQFVQKPYLQLGNNAMGPEMLAVLWHAPDKDEAWGAEARVVGQTKWRKQETMLLRRVDVSGVTPHRVYQATFTKLTPGAEFEYRVLLSSKPVFESKGRARRRPGETHTIAITGDVAQDSEGQRAVAYEIGLAKPDYLVVVGDVVYSRGLVSEYYRKWFPIYNCDEAAPGRCAPILRSTTGVAIPGNHDIGTTVDLSALPDALALFYYWSLPLNGPIKDRQSRNLPAMKGSEEVQRAFYRSAPNFPRMAMYSFDYGDVHWTMLDSNSYVDWTDPGLRDWVRKDLHAAKGAAWRFVGLHHPPFQSSKAHFNDQWMRLLADVFEEEKVDIVFSGHVHNYQRTYPMRFKINPEEARPPMRRGPITGQWTLDKKFDGLSETKPDGVLWIVTGAGGASLYNPEQENDLSTWQEFTTKFISSTHSFSLVEVSPASVTLRQISKDGRQIDQFRITR